MKRKTLARAMVVVMGALCTVPAASAPKASDFIIACTLKLKDSAGKSYYVRSTATSTQAGKLTLTTDDTRATKFAFFRKETFDDGTYGTQYIPVPRGNCMGHTSTQYTNLDKAEIQVDDCTAIARSSWILDKTPTGFVMKYRVDQSLRLAASSLTGGAVLKFVDTDINIAAAVNSTFYTSGCTWANNSKARPRTGTD